MVSNSKKMTAKEVLGDMSPLIVLPFVQAYKAMDKLIQASLSSKPISEDVICLLQELGVSYIDLGISVTLKMHILFFHLIPCLSNPVLEGHGLGLVSGQAGESIHRKFKLFWSKCKMKSLTNPRYGNHLLKAV